VRILLLLLLMTGALQAELKLYLLRTVINEVEVPITPSEQGMQIPFPDIRENDMADLTFEVRNTGPSSESIQNLAVVRKSDVCPAPGGDAFYLMTTIGNPPGMLTPGGSYRFEVRYLPPKPQCYEAYLAMGAKAYVLRAAAAGRTVMYEIDTLGQRQLINGSTSDFGSVRIGEAYIKSYRIVNNTGQNVTIARPSLSGNSGSYTLLEAPEGVRTVPKDGLYEFKVQFTPTRTGLIPGSLTVDNRVIQLIGEGLEAPLPNFTLQTAHSTVDSNTQSHATVQLHSTAASELAGSLELVFEKDVGDMPDDEVIRFVENGARKLPFRIPAGSTQAVFGDSGASTAIFSTGTASGKIRLVAKLSPWENSTVVDIRSDMPRLTEGTIQRANSSLTVQVSGYDNTRSASVAQFRFFDASNREIGDSGGIQVPLGDLFSAFFGASKQGGLFQMRAVFPIDGDTNAVRRVEVTLRNRLGTSPVRTIE
jgi:hypothetical protein